MHVDLRILKQTISIVTKTYTLNLVVGRE